METNESKQTKENHGNKIYTSLSDLTLYPCSHLGLFSNANLTNNNER